YEYFCIELINYIYRKYNTIKFKVAVGHHLMANFMNAFLLKDDPLFKAYINLSPDFIGQMDNHVTNRLKWLKDDVFYYMATSEDDIVPLRNGIRDADQKFAQLN